MIRVESRPHQQAALVLEPNLNRRAARRHRLRRGGRQFHFHKLRRLRLAQPPLPSKKLRSAYPSLAAKRRHTLPAPRLLGNHLPPLRPRLLSALPHSPRMQPRTALRKMGFTERSRKFDTPANRTQMGPAAALLLWVL